MRVALRVEVSSLRGLREGLPNLMRLFSEFQVRATFFFPFGRDYAGRTPLATWRQRKGLGVAALSYGTLAVAPSLAGAAAQMMAVARGKGHEVGVFGHSPLRWRSRLARADEVWVRRQCTALWLALNAAGIGRCSGLATPGWQINPALLRELTGERVAFTSLTRGRLPYFPVLQGVRGSLPEIPTTLPTVDEMLCQPGVDAHNVHEYLYAESQHVLPAGHVFALSAEREGLDRLALMEKLLVMWKGQEGSLRALGDLLAEIDGQTLPSHQVGWARTPGADMHMATQSLQVPR